MLTERAVESVLGGWASIKILREQRTRECVSPFGYWHPYVGYRASRGRYTVPQVHDTSPSPGLKGRRDKAHRDPETDGKTFGKRPVIGGIGESTLVRKFRPYNSLILSRQLVDAVAFRLILMKSQSDNPSRSSWGHKRYCLIISA